ncbi:MAG: sigma-70 family RNA polymerase sigma factor [Ruminococcus sp.]|nr:sigma-70 family RNA polymerase sigma factor [Ruminococcus sp.]
MDNGASSYRRFLSGDNSGMSEIVRSYTDGLIFYINGFVNNIGVSEELTEDVFSVLIADRPRFSEKSSFKTWLFSIARNIAVDYIRRSSKTVGIPIDDMHSLTDGVSVENRYLKEEQRVMLYNAISTLNSDYRQVLFLMYFEDFDTAETARIMKKTKRQVGNLVYRAKQALKNELERSGFEYEEL